VERIKKLHVDKPEPDELRQNDYLHRLILAWDAEEAELLALLEPVRTWLEPEDDDVVRPIFLISFHNSLLLFRLFLT
jgi:hypothetical protein